MNLKGSEDKLKTTSLTWNSCELYKKMRYFGKSVTEFFPAFALLLFFFWLPWWQEQWGDISRLKYFMAGPSGDG